MDIAESDAPANELEALITDLSASGPVVFVFGNGWLTAHLKGATRPLFRGPTERRWWHVELGDPGSKWVLDVRLDQLERVRFIREPNPFPSFPGEESLVVRFESSNGEQTALHCYLQDLYEGARLRPERLCAWDELRRRYGGRDEALVIDGSLRPVAAAASTAALARAGPLVDHAHHVLLTGPIHPGIPPLRHDHSLRSIDAASARDTLADAY